MGYSKARLDKFDDFEEIRRNRLTSKEMKLQAAEVTLGVAVLQSMQECISTELARYMAKEGIGINELTRRLNTSSRQTSRIMKGEANITLATLAEVAGVIGVKARIVFER